MILKFVLSCLYFFLPAYLANMAPPLAKKISFLDFLGKPVDFNKKFLGKPIFGDHKTWRGIISSFFVGMATVFLQKFLFQFPFFREFSLLDYERINIWMFGFLISFGQIFGDIFFSFIKRRLNLEPGAPFLPFDQINYVLGAFLFVEPFFKLGLKVWLFLLASTFFLHIIINRIGFWFDIHSAKW
jgi:CDP-2,3-bis-(O-geranylgeranyl)-sn-glycerol synthase